MLLRLCCLALISTAAPLLAQAPAAAPYSFHPVQIGGGGFISGVLFHPAVKGLAYLRTDIGGAYRWDTAAQRWISLSQWISMEDANLLGIESLAVDPARPDDLYLAAGTYTHPGVPNGALLRSHDRGATFETIRLPFQLGGNEPGRFAGERLLVTPAAIFLGTRNDGLWRSNDHGTTWTHIAALPVQGEKGIGILFLLAGKDALYAGVADREHSLYRSSDGGETWVPEPGAPAGLFPYHAAVDLAGTMYVTYGNAPGPNDVSAGAVFSRSTQGTWQEITPQKPVAGQQGFGYAGLAVDAQHPGTVLVSTIDRWNPGDTIFRLVDQGKHWVSLKESAVRDSSFSPYLNDDHGGAGFGHWIGTVAVDPFNPDHAFYGTGVTVWQTQDLLHADRRQPTHWTVGAQGIEETSVISLLSPPSGAALMAGLGDIGCFRSDHAQQGVAAAATGLRLSNCDSIASGARAPQTLAAVGRTWGSPSHGGYSLDGGGTWTAFAMEPADANDGGKITLNADASAMLWQTHKGVFLTLDRGHTWAVVALKDGLEISADASDAATLTLLDRQAGALYDVHLTPAAKPVAAVTKAAAQAPKGMHLVASATQARQRWLFGNAGLFLVDEDATKTTRMPSIESVYAFGLGRPAPGSKEETLYAAGLVSGAKGVFRSTDRGATWLRLDDAVHAYGWITAVAGDSTTFGRVYLGTNGLGIIVAEPAAAGSATSSK